MWVIIDKEVSTMEILGLLAMVWFVDKVEQWKLRKRAVREGWER